MRVAVGLRVQSDLQLDRQPIAGRLRTEHGGDERFVVSLGFVAALDRLQSRGTEDKELA